jgi:CubicO group peptidase (beta-lactamase class C family)
VRRVGRWLRPWRAAAWRAGLVRDRTRRAVAKVEALLEGPGRERFEASGTPGLAVVVRFADGPVVRRAFGLADASTPMRTDTVFQVLSIGKPVTAAIAAALASEGVVDLDEPVTRRLPAGALPAERFDPRAVASITLRQLLSHTSGIANVVYGYAREDAPAADPLDAFRSEHDEPRRPRVVREPGSAFEYTGAGFVLAEAVLEAAVGIRFATLARDRFLAPLGMISSSFDPGAELWARVATPYDASGAAIGPKRWSATAAANFHSTAEDVTTFGVALMDGPRGEPAGRGVLPPSACAEVLRVQHQDVRGAGWGLGVRLKWNRFERRFVHVGYDQGWYGHLEGLLRRRVAFAVLTNGYRGRDCVASLASAIRHVLYDEAY